MSEWYCGNDSELSDIKAIVLRALLESNYAAYEDEDGYLIAVRDCKIFTFIIRGEDFTDDIANEAEIYGELAKRELKDAKARIEKANEESQKLFHEYVEVPHEASRIRAEHMVQRISGYLKQMEIERNQRGY